MTYEQSLKNIEALKNLVWPWDTEYVFFDFYNYTEFKIIFLNQAQSYRIEDFIKDKFSKELPFTHIRVTSAGHDVLYYEDIIIRYEYNLTTQQVLMNDFKIFKRRSSAEVKLDMAKLFFKLKNM